ncbi:MAG: protein jag [Lachnospiraceae bacterium]|nr:protein jag [Lachnospiraceae bacterium]
MEYMEFSAKTVQDAITEACTHFIVTSSSLEYEVVDEGTTGFLGIGSKPAVIKARVKSEEIEDAKSVFTQEAAPDKKEVKEVKAEAKKENKKENKPNQAKKENNVKKENVQTSEKAEVKEENTKKREINVNAEEVENKAVQFLKDVLSKMEIQNEVKAKYDAEENCLNIEIAGEDMGVLIGKRGQTLDSLQYLVSLVVNKGTKEYIRVKVDTENYRERRNKTLENLAKNMAFKVKRTRRSVTLEPMNPYERRVIHSALQNDSYVTTHSEGEEPYRKVVITLKK